MLSNILVSALVILVILALLILVMWLFEKFVSPIPQVVKGVVIFVVAAILIILAIANKGIRFDW